MKKSMGEVDYSRSSGWHVWICRGLVIIVLLLNLQAALWFMISPARFTAAFELTGVPGRAAIQGVGILFLMWQVPYVFAAIHPVRQRVSLITASLMQLIGLLGETLLLFSIPVEYGRLRGSITRFIWFDGMGLVLLLAALIIAIRIKNLPKDRL